MKIVATVFIVEIFRMLLALL